MMENNIPLFISTFIILVQLLTTTLALSSPQMRQQCYEKCGILFDPMPEAQGKSMGSVIAPEYAYPWVVLLMTNIVCGNEDGKIIQDRCTGFIVNDKTIVTAAHCIYSNYTDELVRCGAPQQKIEQHKRKIIWHPLQPNQITIYAGFENLGQPKDYSMVFTDTQIDGIEIGNDFTPEQMETGMLLKDDYAIIKLIEPIPFGEKIRPICLSRLEPIAPLRQYGYWTMAGWGKKAATSIALPPNELNVVVLPSINNDECSHQLGKIGFNEYKMFCAGGRSRGGLEGDSGSPLMYHNLFDRMYAIGIYSMETTPSKFKNVRPDVFTKITPALCDHLKQLNSGNEVCHPHPIAIGPDCDSILREVRLELAEKACNDEESECKTGVRTGKLSMPAAIANVESKDSAGDADAQGKFCTYSGMKRCPAGYVCHNFRCHRRCYYGVEKCPHGFKCKSSFYCVRK